MSVSGESIELRDMTSDELIVQGSKTFDGGDVVFYFESEKEMYWSFDCGAEGKILFSAVIKVHDLY